MKFTALEHLINQFFLGHLRLRGRTQAPRDARIFRDPSLHIGANRLALMLVRTLDRQRLAHRGPRDCLRPDDRRATGKEPEDVVGQFGRQQGRIGIAARMVRLIDGIEDQHHWLAPPGDRFQQFPQSL